MKTLITTLFLMVAVLPWHSKVNAITYNTIALSGSKNTDPEVVATLSDRDAIPLAFRAERMYVYVADNHKVYQLRGGVTNAHWVELDIASSMKIQGPAGSLPYIDPTGLLATDLRYLGKAKYDFSGANFLGSGQYVNVNGVGNRVNDRSHNTMNAYNSYSDGNYVMIIGERDSALAQGNIILGDDISLRAPRQLAAGRGLIGQTNGEVLFGQYNAVAGNINSQWQSSDRLLTLGNGTSATNRSNALVIYKNGDAEFSGNLSAKNIYSKLQVDSMFVVNGSGGGSGIVQSLNLNGTQLTITGSNTVNFQGWDTDASDDFSGDFNDLTNAPNFSTWDQNAADDFSGDYNDLINQPSFAGWDTDASDDFSGDFNDLTNTPNFSAWDQNAADDFSGDYNDLTNQPDIYLRPEVDSAIAANISAGAIQNLNLNGTQLSISGGNSINFAGWDTDASDDFNGDYNSLSNLPKLFSGDYNDLANKPTLFSGNYNDLLNKPNFTNWDQNAADDFSGDYMDLVNRPSFVGWDTDASDDFSGDYNDLINKPALFSGNYNDLSNRPSFNGWDTDASDDFSGDFNDLTNTPNFSGWDQNAADDFSGDYNDLSNKPVLFSGNYNDLTNKPKLFSGDYNQLINKPTFSGWDTDVTDDFSGDYNDLVNQPDIYSRPQVDSVVAAHFGGGGLTQTLNLTGTSLSITGGNSVDFSGWDTDVSDDFSGDFNDLSNVPADLQDGMISWGEVDQKPLLYTQNQVDSIRQSIVDSMIAYVDSALISQDANELIANRSLSIQDVGKTVYTRSNTGVLSIPAGAGIPFNGHIELRDFGSGSFILDASAVTLRDAAGDVLTGNTAAIVIEDAAITAIGNDEYKIIGLYQ